YTAAHYDTHAAELEAFARPLWGLVPLAAGGGQFSEWELYRRGLTNGTDPAHPEYWGMPRDSDQRLVEMAAFGLALMLVPHEVWEPLDSPVQTRLAQWLNTINCVGIVDS